MDLKNYYTENIKEIIDGVSIIDESTYTIEKEHVHVFNPQAHVHYHGKLSDFGDNELNGEAKQWLLQSLASSIYQYYYTGTKTINTSLQYGSLKERNDFMDQLSIANMTQEGWDCYWQVYSIDGQGNIFAKKNEDLRWVMPNTWKYSDPSVTQVQVNTFIDLQVKKEDRSIQPVFYYINGEQSLPQYSDIVRMYWNIDPTGVATLIREITTLFNSYRIPFQFKCLNHPTLYNRKDNGVLYLLKRDIPGALILIEHIAQQVASFAKEGYPLFTRPLYKGVSFAEDPGNGESFGMNRCTAIAKEIVASSKKKKADILKNIINMFKQQDISLNKLHLHPHSAFDPITNS